MIPMETGPAYMDLRMNDDYSLNFEPLPWAGVFGVICENADGTFSIYINTTYDHRKQMDTILHALRIVAARKEENTI